MYVKCKKAGGVGKALMALPLRKHFFAASHIKMKLIYVHRQQFDRRADKSYFEAKPKI